MTRDPSRWRDLRARLDRFQIALATVLLAAVLLPGLGRAGLLDPWEMDRAAVARRMAAGPRVLVVEGADGALLGRLEQAAPGRFGLVRPVQAGEPTAAVALQQAVAWLTRQVAHAVVVDADAALGARADAAARLDAAGGQIAQIGASNRGSALLVVTAADPAPLRRAIGAARARTFLQQLRGSILAGVLDGDDHARALGPLLGGPEVFVSPTEVVAAVQAHTPSPWLMPIHKQDGQVVTVPWLEAALTAASLRAFGPNELAARLGEAVLTLLAGLVVVVTARRLWGAGVGWLALFVYATLPMTWGLGRSVTFEASLPLGLALSTGGLALLAAAGSRLGGLWFGVGLLICLFGKGLGGLAMATGIAVAAALALGEWRRGVGLAALAAGVVLAAASAWVLGDSESLLLRSLRFTQWPFGGGPDVVHRDFAWFVGQLGFGVYPWGAAIVLGGARLLGPAEADEPQAPSRQRAAAVLLAGLVVPLAAVSMLIKQFHHFVAPLGPIAALVAAALLADLLAGRVSGRVVAVFVGLSTLLLHREIGKGAEAVTRFVTFDPPVGTANLPWPEELALPRALRAVALLAVLAFALGAARPLGPVQTGLAHLRRVRPAAWALGVVGIVWALDALISLGTRLDVLLKTSAATTGYGYDRVWVTIQGLRPEVIAGATLFALTLVLAAIASVGDGTGLVRRAWLRWILKLGAVLGRPTVALGVVGVAGLCVLAAGCAVLVAVQHVGYGTAVATGLGSAAFVVPFLVAVVAVACALLGRRRLDRTADGGTLLEPLLRGAAAQPLLAVGVPALVALAGIGIGASQAAGTWTYPYLGAIWALAVLVLLVVAGRAQTAPAGYGWPLFGMGLVVAATVFVPLASRYVGELGLQAQAAGQDAAAGRADAFKHLLRVLLAAPDTGLLVGVALLLAANRLAARQWRLDRAFDFGLRGVGKLEQPRVAAAALVVAGVVFSAGYAFSLLPGLSVHYSQKHLLVRIAEAGGAGTDPAGAPRTFTHGATRTGSDNNFYTQSMPAIDDRQAVLALLADRNVATRVTDNARGGATTQMALAGWSDGNDKDKDGKRDAPAWFGIAGKVDGAQVQVPEAKWQPDAWKGARLFGPDGPPVDVVGNTADTLTLAAPPELAPADPARGAFSLDLLREGPTGHQQHAAPAPIQRFVVVPKDAFSELNHAFRQAHGGRHVPVLDAESSRLVLATNRLQPGQADQNWIARAVITPEQLAATKDVRRVQINFDNSLHLVGYKLAEPSVARSQKYKMTLYWKVVRPTPTSWKMFMHPHPLHLDRWPLTDPDPSEDDNKPCLGCFQTNHWLQGDLIADSFEQDVPLGTNAGPNEIILGWYNPSTDQRMPVVSASGDGVHKHADNRVTIGHLQVR